MHIPLDDLLQRRYVEQQNSHGLTDTEVFERRIQRLLDCYFRALESCHSDILGIDGTLTIKFTPSSEGLEINMKYDDGMDWNTPEDREDFNTAMSQKLRSEASRIRFTKQHLKGE